MLRTAILINALKSTRYANLTISTWKFIGLTFGTKLGCLGYGASCAAAELEISGSHRQSELLE